MALRSDEIRSEASAEETVLFWGRLPREGNREPLPFGLTDRAIFVPSRHRNAGRGGRGFDLERIPLPEVRNVAVSRFVSPARLVLASALFLVLALAALLSILVETGHLALQAETLPLTALAFGGFMILASRRGRPGVVVTSRAGSYRWALPTGRRTGRLTAEGASFLSLFLCAARKSGLAVMNP